MKVTIPSLPKENGVTVKINVIELRSPQASFNWQLISRVCFDAIVRPIWNTSGKAETSVTESPEN